MQQIRSFGFGARSGAAVYAPVMVGQDGALYGTTVQGGDFKNGTVFKVNMDGSGFAVLMSFANTNGSRPGYLLQGPDGFLYGTTGSGGTNGGGTVFKLNTNGSGFKTLHSFFAPGGPGGLIWGSEGVLYGACSPYGSTIYGNVFKIYPDGTGYTSLHTFSGIGQGARSPVGHLLQASDGMLYGAASDGGTNGYGAVFKLDATGSGYAEIHEFGSGSDGQTPDTGLIQGIDGALYGTTFLGGTNDAGTVYKLSLDGSSYQILHTFPSNTVGPEDQLLQGTDGLIYGSVSEGGYYAEGLIFRMDTNGAAYTVLHNFGAENDGVEPVAGLIQASNGILFGTTSGGGPASAGTVFGMGTNGTGYFSVHNFSAGGGDAEHSWSALVQGSDGVLYGTSKGGGTNGYGCAFKLSTDGSNYTVLHDFGSGPSDGQRPLAALIQGKDGALYGTTSAGGIGTNGTIFKLAAGTGAYSVLHSLDASGNEGILPRGALLQGTDGALYGTAWQGGTNGRGAVFKIGTNGIGFTVIYSFTTNSGDSISPDGALVQAPNGVLYGLTMDTSGPFNQPTVYRLNPDGSGYGQVYTFLIQETGSSRPDAALTFGKDGLLYGAESAGRIFKLSTNGLNYTVLHFFNKTGDGGTPYGRLIQGGDGALYGTTYLGGSNGFGTVYKINPDSSGYTQAYYFKATGGDGQNPYGGVIQGSDGALYGTTLSGGVLGVGTVFRLTGPLIPPLAITSHPASLTNRAGTTASFSVVASSTLALGYQWQRNGTNLTDGPNISGSTNPVLSLGMIDLNDTGTYAVVVTNALGSVSSSNAFLRVVVPPSFTSITRLSNRSIQLSLSAVSNVNFRVEATTNLVDWTTLTNLSSPVGTIQYIDSKATNFPRRFYRAHWGP